MVVGSGYRHRINILPHFIQQFPIVLEPLGVGELLGFLVQRVGVHVTEGDNVPAATSRVAAVAIPLSPNPDSDHIDAIVGAQDIPHIRESQGRRAGCDGGSFDKIPSSKCVHICV